MRITLSARYLPLIIVLGAMLVSSIIIGQAYAQSSDSLASVAFPIAELGSCKDKADCKAYCDKPGNMEACIAFAEKNGLMPKEEVAKAKKFISAGGKGPGGCTSKETCETYCENIENMDACVAFAEQTGMMSAEELDEAKKVQAAIKRGVKPPACASSRSCDAYCELAENIEECVAFASEAGFMSAEEKENAQKMIQAVKKGVKPPACRGKEDCDRYCSDDSHIDECIAFAEAAGFIKPEEVEMARKTRGKGPGGCVGKEACDAFCSQPDNEVFCINFAKENGLLSEERLREMEADDARFKTSFDSMPPEVLNCLTEAAGADVIAKLKAGALRPNAIGDKMSTCFKQMDELRDRLQSERMQSGSKPEFMEGPTGGYGSSEGRPPEGQGSYPYPFTPGSECQGEKCPPPEAYRVPPTAGSGYPCEGENCRPPESMPKPGTIESVPGTYAVPPEYDQTRIKEPTASITTDKPADGTTYSAPIETAPLPTTPTAPVPTTETQSTAPSAPESANQPTSIVPRDNLMGAVISIFGPILFIGK